MIIYHAIFDGDLLIRTELECEDTKHFIIIKKTEFTKQYHINKCRLEQVTMNKYTFFIANKCLLELYTIDNDERLIRQKMYDFLISQTANNKSQLKYIAEAKINRCGLWELEKKDG